MTRDMSSLIAMTKALCSEAQYDIDTSMAPLAFNQQVILLLSYTPNCTPGLVESNVNVILHYFTTGYPAREYALPHS